MSSNCGVREGSWESLDSKEIKPVNLKGNQPWIVIGRLTLKLWYFGDWCKQPTHWKSPRCWETLWVEEEGVWGWDSWMASPMQWTWTWANFRRWWGTGRPGVLQSMGSQRVRHDWVTVWYVTCKQWEFYFFFSNLFGEGQRSWSDADCFCWKEVLWRCWGLFIYF